MRIRLSVIIAIPRLQVHRRIAFPGPSCLVRCTTRQVTDLRQQQSLHHLRRQLLEHASFLGFQAVIRRFLVRQHAPCVVFQERAWMQEA